MNRLKRALPALTVFAAVLLSGVVHGIWTDRWDLRDGPKVAAARLTSVPLAIGDWDGQDLESNPREREIAQVSGELRRRYVNRRTGGVVTLLLLCGRPGPVSVHTPDVCYRGAGYEEDGAVAKQALPAPLAAEFWVRKFHKAREAAPVHLRIFYAWGANGAWKAADNPRFTFAREPALYKLYVIRELPREDEPVAEDPSLEFLGALVPQLERCLFPGP